MYLYVPKGWRECSALIQFDSGLESKQPFFYQFITEHTWCSFLAVGILYPCWKLKSCLVPQLHDGKYGNVGALADSAADTAEEEICCDIHRAIEDYRGRSQLKLQGWTPNTATRPTLRQQRFDLQVLLVQTANMKDCKTSKGQNHINLYCMLLILKSMVDRRKFSTLVTPRHVNPQHTPPIASRDLCRSLVFISRLALEISWKFEQEDRIVFRSIGEPSWTTAPQAS